MGRDVSNASRVQGAMRYPGHLSSSSHIYSTDVIRVSYVFRRTVSFFSFYVIISQLKCKDTKAVVTSLVFIIKYSD